MRRLFENKNPSSTYKDEKQNIYLMLLPMVLGICLCAVCLVGSTFAWFVATQTTSTQSIQAASYGVDVKVKVVNGQALDPNTNGGAYTLVGEQSYTVTLEAKGTASTGYCIVYLEDESGEITEYHTVYLPTKETLDSKSISFTLNPSEKMTMTFMPQWGSSSKNDGEKWRNEGVYLSKQKSDLEPIEENAEDSENIEDSEDPESAEGADLEME